MSTIAFTWTHAKPTARDVYTTRRNSSKYLTLRYWDGSQWWEIAYSASRGGNPFVWPKKSRSHKPEWVKDYASRLCLRAIKVHQDKIEWGEPYKVYDDKEVLVHLVKTGVLPADWKTAYQAEMRSAA